MKKNEKKNYLLCKFNENFSSICKTPHISPRLTAAIASSNEEKLYYK